MVNDRGTRLRVEEVERGRCDGGHKGVFGKTWGRFPKWNAAPSEAESRPSFIYSAFSAE